MDNINNLTEEQRATVEQAFANPVSASQEEIEELLSDIGIPIVDNEEPSTAPPELTDEEIDAILNEAANEMRVEMPDVVESEHNIEPNSPTILLDETHSRFSSAEWAKKIEEQTVILGGCGGISSWTSLLLSRVNPHYIHIYDDDIVEQANMSGQLFRNIDMNAHKVNAMYQIITQFSNYYNTVCNRTRINANSHIFNPIMICGFDNMQARKDFYTLWKKGINDGNKENCLLLDGRLSAEEFQIFCIRGTDEYRMKEYEEKWLFNDEEAEQTVCSYKQTSHCACMIASMIVNLFTNFIANLCNPLVERDLPFLTYYNAQTMYLKTES